MSDGELDLEKLRLTHSASVTPHIPRRYQPRRGDRFLRGPVPWPWLEAAAKVGGKGRALHVALTLWFRSGLERSLTVPLSYKACEGMGVDRFAAYRGLKALEAAHLVQVLRSPGRSPIVTLIVSGPRRGAEAAVSQAAQEV